MARWKLSRIEFGDEEFSLEEGEEISIGRSLDNKVSLSSLVISRNHCIIKADKGKLTITDLKSANGIYVGIKKIPPAIPYEIKDNDRLGIGWTKGAPVKDIGDDKYMFKVSKLDSMPNRIKFEVDSDVEGIKREIEKVKNEPAFSGNVNIKQVSSPSGKLVPSSIQPSNNTVESTLGKQNKENINNLSYSDNSKNEPGTSKAKITSPALETKRNLKRQLEKPLKDQIKEPEARKCRIYMLDEDIINISDSETDIEMLPNNILKPVLETLPEETPTPVKEEIKTEIDNANLEYFNMKQEYLGYDDEAIQIDSDSDSENEQWYMRLSQSSPGKPFMKVKRDSKVLPEDSSYSQIDDFVDDLIEEEETDEDYEYDMISIPPRSLSEDQDNNTNVNKIISNSIIQQTDPGGDATIIQSDEEEDFLNDLISLEQPVQNEVPIASNEVLQTEVPHERPKESVQPEGSDLVDGVGQTELPREVETIPIASNSRLKFSSATELPVPKKSKTQMIEPLMSPTHKPYGSTAVETKHRPVQSYLTKGLSSPRKRHKNSTSKRHISKSQKEERKRKLKQIASKVVLDIQTDRCHQSASGSKEKDKTVSTNNVKVTSSNRGAFLSDTILAVKPVKRSPQTGKRKEKTDETLSKIDKDCNVSEDHATTKVKHTKEKTDETPSKIDKDCNVSEDHATTKVKHTKMTKEHATNDKYNKTTEKQAATNDKDTTKIYANVPTNDRDSKNIEEHVATSATTNKHIKYNKEPVVKKITESGSSKLNNKTKHREESTKRTKRISESTEDCHNNNNKHSNKHSKEPKSDKRKPESKPKSKDEKSRKSTDRECDKVSADSGISLKSLKPLSSSETEQFSGKPFSKVEPLPPKKVKKTLRFTEEPPQVHVFQIEEGNKMKKTSLAKSTLVDARQRPATFSLEKVTMIKILRWNPHWLDEQMSNNEPPPILGNSNSTMAVFHFFQSHHQYVTMISDLLLMEIWESLTQGHVRSRSSPGLPMRIAHMPPPPSPDRCFELFTLSVDVSVPNSEVKKIPRIGDLLIVSFGPENAKNLRFLYVHHVRCLPSPPKNVNSFFCLSLHACYTDKMKSLRQGELMIGVNLGYIQKEMLLFEAMDYLAGSPLLDAILSPKPRHFIKEQINPACLRSNYTGTLNAAQQRAVEESVTAALGDRPCINMVQGPPGTGKSSVISAIIMSYFNDENRKRYGNRGKVLICATSNAAVDELVCRLLLIRQELERRDRFRLVRVGRTEAMHKVALDVSSQMLAKRDAARVNSEPAKPGLNEEISHLEAKINMWKTQAQDAKDPVRVAFCQQRVSNLANRIALLRSGGGGGSGSEELRGEQLLAVERRIIEGADIIVTTLASAHSHKLRGLKGRIALCIVDEAGQAIEPETLIPLTLDVTKLTLIGDPQQLPGYICSQRARKHGLGESLFSRISSCTEHWPEGSVNPIILLNQQYRMHPEIADYPNRAFYNSLIQTMVSSMRPKLPIPPYLILSVPSGDKGQGVCGGNEAEAWGVARLVTSLAGVVKRVGRDMTPPNDLSLAVITPYNGQKELIKRNLRTLQEPGSVDVEVNTVDSFQGQERDVVVVSLARSQGVGFLTDSGRMNVMLTRAKLALIVCLNPNAMVKNLQWRTLVEDAQRRKLYKVLPNKMCTRPSPSDNKDEILQYIATQRQGHN